MLLLVKSTAFTALYFISAREVHPLKATSPILVTLSGIVTLVNELQSENADFPMLSTPSEIVTLVTELQSENADSSMLVTL